VSFVVHDVHCAVGALGERFLDRLFHALRPHRYRNHFAGVFLLQAKGFLERETVRFIHFKSDVGLADPSAIDNYQGGVFGGDLLDANDNLHPHLTITERGL